MYTRNKFTNISLMQAYYCVLINVIEIHICMYFLDSPASAPFTKAFFQQGIIRSQSDVSLRFNQSRKRTFEGTI